MNVRTPLLAGLAVSALIVSGASAAPGHTAAPVTAAVSQGPPIPGYCVFSINEIIGRSKVGQSVVARLKVLGSQVSAELQPEADSIRTDGRALESRASGMDQASLQAQRANLQLRVANFQKREQQRQEEMRATQQKQFGVILKELDPIMREIYQERRCSILVDGDSGGVRMINPTMDLSAAAVSGLDEKIQTLTFDREHLDTQESAAAPAR